MEDRNLLKMVDEMIMSATPKELEEIQRLDREWQLKGVSFCDIWRNTMGQSRRLRANNRR